MDIHEEIKKIDAELAVIRDRNAFLRGAKQAFEKILSEQTTTIAGTITPATTEGV